MKFHEIVIKTLGGRLIFSDELTGNKFIECPKCGKMALIINESVTNAIYHNGQVYDFEPKFEVYCPHCKYLEFEDKGGRIL